MGVTSYSSGRRFRKRSFCLRQRRGAGHFWQRGSTAARYKQRLFFVLCFQYLPAECAGPRSRAGTARHSGSLSRARCARISERGLDGQRSHDNQSRRSNRRVEFGSGATRLVDKASSETLRDKGERGTLARAALQTVAVSLHLRSAGHEAPVSRWKLSSTWFLPSAGSSHYGGGCLYGLGGNSGSLSCPRQTYTVTMAT